MTTRESIWILQVTAFIDCTVSLGLPSCPLHQTVNCPKENLTLGPSLFPGIASIGWYTGGSSESETGSMPPS